MLQLKNIRKDYVTASETVNALKGVTISFRQREFVSILGPSGCGKTTLLNIIGGLDHYTSGDLVINGRSTESYSDRDWDVYRNHRVGFIFQSYNLIPHQTVLGNVELALTIAGIGKEERVERAKRALDRVGLAGQYYKRPNQLSGGQCQRVAIARALVNDPEILLADEPTGALDTHTSVQIMDLIKEISGERLVIMVTHNPELAEKYSTRIVRLLDGNLTEDSNPMTDAEEAAELAAQRAAEDAEREAFLAASEAEQKRIKKERKKRREKAKMSFFTAFRLSARNLLSKKGRTTMVGIAGSIGIVGIAMVLAFSAGIKGYVAAMQDDMLSGNPITITETAYDMEAISKMMNDSMGEDTVREEHKVYIDSMIEYIAKMTEFSNAFFIKNEITREYVEYVRNMPKEYYNAMTFGYGLDLTHSIYTSFVHDDGNGNEVTDRISIAALTSMYTSVLEETEYSSYARYITQIVPSFRQAPNNPDYIRSQYTVYGEVADEYDEVMLVLNGNQELSDVLLARLGIYSEAEFYNLVYKNASKPTDEELAAGEFDLTTLYNPEIDVESFDYDYLLSEDVSFVWYPNDQIYTANKGITMPDGSVINTNPFSYHHNAKDISGEGVTLRISGILIANEGTNFGCLSSGIYYTEELTDYILAANSSSEIVEYVKDKGAITSMNYGGMPVGIYYNYQYKHISPTVKDDGTEEILGTDMSFVGESLGMDDIMGSMAQGGSGGSSGGSGGTGGTGIDAGALAQMKTVSARMLGGDDVANSISIYPISFDSKDLATNYLDAWNDDKISITVDGVEYAGDGRANVTYTDTLEIIITMINTMIDVISYALIAFTSISLVVSTVMIGIITYVSVVERIKEIGVIRSLGGRKKDVSNLFIAETFIIGLLAGIIGVLFTYFASLIANMILHPLINYPNIAALPVSQAVLLILLSVGLTLVSGLIPASSAAKKDPVVALRTE